MLPLGTKAPDFSLVSVDGTTVSRSGLEGAPALLVIFMCNHCPYVVHVADELSRLTAEYQQRGVAIVGINSNDATKYPQDSPEQMVHEAEQRGYVFAYLHDDDQSVAKAYHAACTPDFFVFDKNHRLVYRGQMDESRPNSGTVPTGKDLRAALDAVLAGETPLADQTPSIGCNIKWKDGCEPTYYNSDGMG
jgi:peroxiredoxin